MSTTKAHANEPLTANTALKLPPAVAKQRQQRLLLQLAKVLPWVAVLALWQAISLLWPPAVYLLSSPTEVTAKLVEWLSGPVWPDVWVTLRSAAIGYVLGVLLACLMILVVMPFTFLRDFVRPFVVLLNAVPQVAIAPVYILWFGIGLKASVVFVVTAIFLIVFLNLYAGIDSIDPIYAMNARTLGAGPSMLIREVYLPAAFGWLMTSLKVAAAWAILGASLAEYLAGTSGLGHLMMQGSILAEASQVAAAATLLAVIGVIANVLLGRVEARYSKWRIF